MSLFRLIRFFRSTAASGPYVRFAISAAASLLTVGGSALITTLTTTTKAYAQVSIKAYISAPNSQFAPDTVTGKLSETFNAQAVTPGSTLTTFASAIGTYSGQYAILADDNFGTGTGNYFAFGNRNSSATLVSLTFASDVKYFGLSYNAGDTNNGISFYDASNNLLGRYSTSQLISALQGGAANTTVTAQNGNVYQTSFFYGKPTGGAVGTAQSATINHSEPSAFLSFFISGGTVKKVVFDNSGNSTTTGFESDNHTISTAAQSVVGGDFVYVGSTDTPEAGTLTLLSTGLSLLVGGVAIRSHRIRTIRA